MIDKIAVYILTKRVRGRTDGWDADLMWNSMQFYEREAVLEFMKYTKAQIESQSKLLYSYLPSETCADLDKLFKLTSKRQL
jgi:hypothetical protein